SPGGLPVIGGVKVTQAGGDDEPAGVAPGAARAGGAPGGRDASAVDRHVALARRRAAAVDDGAPAQDEIVHVSGLPGSEARCPSEAPCNLRRRTDNRACPLY